MSHDVEQEVLWTIVTLLYNTYHSPLNTSVYAIKIINNNCAFSAHPLYRQTQC